MSEKQKAIIDMLVRLEYAINDTLKDAAQEGLAIGTELNMPRFVHFYVAMPKLEEVPNDVQR